MPASIESPSPTGSAAAIAKSAGYPALASRISKVEEGLSTAVLTSPKLLAESAGHLLTAGGKRVRPALTLLCAEVVEPNCVDAVAAAVACELVHLGSLHHDDVIDEAQTRRGVPTVNVGWSNTVAVLSGDFLLARASHLAATLGADAAAMLADAIGRLTAGEILELENLFDTSTSLDSYFETIRGKTASLMGISCRLGACVAGASPSFEDLSERFGIELGVAFQIIDDVLDLVADEATTGKERGIDLREGVYTLPTLLALERDEDESLRGHLHRDLSHDDVTAAIELIISCGGVAHAVDAAATHLAQCDALLGEFPESKARDALGRLSRYILERSMLEI